MNTITVTGYAEMKIRPDTTKVSLDLSSIHKNYDDAIRIASKNVEEIKEIIILNGFKNDDLKTTNYSIKPRYENYKADDGSYKSRQIGYEYNEALEFSFSNDNVLLGKLLYEISNSKLNAIIKLSFFNSNIEELKDELLAKCVRSAKKKAIILADSANVLLGEIINIEHGDYHINYFNDEYEMGANQDNIFLARSYDVNINPDDIKLKDKVTITWELKGDKKL